MQSKIKIETDNIANQFYADNADDLIFDESVSPERQLSIKNTLSKATELTPLIVEFARRTNPSCGLVPI